MVPDASISGTASGLGGGWITCYVQRPVYDKELLSDGDRVPELRHEMRGLLIDEGCAVGTIKFENIRDVRERRNIIFGYGGIPTTDAPPTLERSE